MEELVTGKWCSFLVVSQVQSLALWIRILYNFFDSTSENAELED